MELWIRNQDKDYMVKVEKLNLVYDCLCSDEVQLIHIDSDKGRLGSYSTEERALEVLDEIQRHLVIINDRDDNTFYVYEMPEE